jgi:DYW family of nucleic acid deaminases
VGRSSEWVEGEEGTGKMVMVGVHSERLALGFAFLSVPDGVTIRVMKNLRMCKDCHDWFKWVGEIVGSLAVLVLVEIIGKELQSQLLIISLPFASIPNSLSWRQASHFH